MSSHEHITAESKPTVRRRIGAFALGSREPPEALQLWNFGPNPTDYGVHIWNERSIEEVVATYNARGNPLPVDIEHKIATKDPATPAPETGGYARLEIRDGLPWVVFDWSAVAVEQIKTGQRRFLSPDYDVDKATGEIVRLYRVALVADPGTHHARTLASSLTSKGPAMHPMLLAALKAALTAQDPKAAIESLLQELESAGATGMPTADEEPVTATDTEKPESPPEDGDKPVPAPGEDKLEKTAAAPVMPEKKSADENVKPYAAASGNTPTGPGVDADKSKVAASSADPAVAAVAADLADFKRNVLLESHGQRLDPSVRVWASSQSYDVVKGLLDSLPDAPTAPARPSVTRGATQGIQAYGRDGFQPGTPEFAEYQRITGTAPAEPIGPRILPNGVLRISAGCPGEWRKQEAERVRAAGGQVK